MKETNKEKKCKGERTKKLIKTKKQMRRISLHYEHGFGVMLVILRRCTPLTTRRILYLCEKAEVEVT